MRIGSLNIKGMNKLLKQVEVLSLFQHNKLDILGLMETRLRSAKAPPIQRKQFRHFFVLDNYYYHNNGHIWVIWRDSAISVKVLDMSSQWIHFLVSRGKVSMEVTFVYGFNHTAQRVPLWDFLEKQVNCGLPWLVLGDINCVRSTEERISSDPPNIAAMDNFNDVIANSGLVELKTIGCFFTWTNKQDLDDRKWIKLDRALVNTEWLQLYPEGFAEALTAGILDHSPLVISLISKTQHRPASFKFLNCWSQDEKFLPMVQQEWQSGVSGCKIYTLVQHLRRLKSRLTHLHKTSFTGVTAKVKELQQRLKLCQIQLQLDPTNLTLLAEEEAASKDYYKFKNIELSIAYQRAKEFDIKMGDASTSYFYSKIDARRNSSMITKVLDLQGVKCTEAKDIEAAFLAYYTNLLRSEAQVQDFDLTIMTAGYCLTTEEGAP
ncbi:uncharacterized protein LOC141651422 [Silene latifolia]|uniref:uncharacterized protein LOC141651422 n=1 Tax=Silene latifolia TaxID=37657 RepID=UPI003D786DF4